MQHVPSYSRPTRTDDMREAAYFLHAYEVNGTWIKNGTDLLADDIESRRAVVEMLEETSRGWFKAGAAGDHAYSLPDHMRLIGIIWRARTGLFLSERRRAA